MKGLKIIPMFLGLMVLTYVGMLFVEANHEDVVISMGSYYQSLPIPLGFVVLSAILIGMCICGVLCSVEILALYMQNRNLRRRLTKYEERFVKDRMKDGNHSSDKGSRHEPVEPAPGHGTGGDIARGH